MLEQALWEVWRKRKNYTQNPPPPPVSMLQHLGLRLRDLHGDKTTEDPFT